jgi:hypothetical protein
MAAADQRSQALFRLVADTETELVPTDTDVRTHNYSS